MIYRVSKDKSDKWRWKLQADNARTIAVSGEGYANLEDCVNGIDLVRSTYSKAIQVVVRRDKEWEPYAAPVTRMPHKGDPEP